MQVTSRRLARGIGAALGVSVIAAGATLPAFAAAPTALQKAAEKAASAKQADPKKDESLAFDPFAPGAAVAPAAAAAAPAAPQASNTNEAAARQAARDAILAKLAKGRPEFWVQINKVRAQKRSPNGPPPGRPRRPSDPPGPPANVPPGPPQHAPPGPPR